MTGGVPLLFGGREELNGNWGGGGGREKGKRKKEDRGGGRMSQILIDFVDG